MTDIEIPDNEEAACDLDGASIRAHRNEEHAWGRAFSGAARRLRADAEEIARLEAELATAKTEAAAQRELATLLERESPDPLTRIAAALERPSREWVAALILAARAVDESPWSREVHVAKDGADALLAEMGEG